jgi:two-component system, OmpR family, KDP operon response regulator KdpE
MGELLARLRAALRRDEGETGQGQPRQATIGQWRVDLAAHRVTSAPDSRGEGRGAGRAAAGKEGASGTETTLRLTPTEWRILEYLVGRPGQLVSSAELLTGVWGPEFQQRTNYLRFHMARLRRKLEGDPARPRQLLTEPGMGYRYQP